MLQHTAGYSMLQHYSVDTRRILLLLHTAGNIMLHNYGLTQGAL